MNKELSIASQNGHIETVKEPIKKGVDVNIKDKNGHTALMDASQKGHAKIVEMLIKKGVKNG